VSISGRRATLAYLGLPHDRINGKRKPAARFGLLAVRLAGALYPAPDGPSSLSPPATIAYASPRFCTPPGQPCYRRSARGSPQIGTRPVWLRAAWPVLSGGSSLGGAREAAALVLATQEFVANGGGRPPRSAPPECCIARADGQPWPCRSAWAGGVPQQQYRRLRPGHRTRLQLARSDSLAVAREVVALGGREPSYRLDAKLKGVAPAVLRPRKGVSLIDGGIIHDMARTAWRAAWTRRTGD
jgi:hypothetical protein